jgi:hypothetical protein
VTVHLTLRRAQPAAQDRPGYVPRFHLYLHDRRRQVFFLVQAEFQEIGYYLALGDFITKNMEIDLE